MAAIEPLTRGDVSVAVSLGALAVAWTAENVAWAPDVARDMQARTMEMMKEIMAEAYQYGLLSLTGEEAEAVDVDVEGDESG